MYTQLLSVFAASVAIVTAYPPPTGNPTGNAIIKPGLNEIVPAGSPYTITWQPTTTGNTCETIALVLLRGPSTNVVPIATIVDNYQNSGTYSWTPSTDLQPDTTHYGLQLICDDTGAYQYSTQFGISNSQYTGGSSSASGSASASASASSYASAPASGGSASASGYASATSSSRSQLFSSAPGGNSTYSSATLSSGSLSTATSTVTKASGSATKTASGSSGSSSPSTVSTNGGAAIKFSVGGAVAAVAVAVAAL